MKRPVLLALSAGLLFAGLPAQATTRGLFEPSLLGAPRPGPAGLLAQIGGEKESKEPETAPPGHPEGWVNPRKAMLYSLILPGLGQQIAGRSERARVFYGVEAAIWTSFAVFRLQGDARRDRYIEYAQFNAGVDPAGKDGGYWRTIAQYERSDPGPFSANELVRRQARALYPGDRDAQEAYFQSHAYLDNNAWDWQTSDNLDRYRTLRSSSLDSYNRAQFSIAMALVNRLVSMIDAARSASRANRALQGAQRASEGPDLQLGMRLMNDGGERVPVLTLKTRF